MLNNIVDNLEQCGQHNIVQCCFYQARTGCAFFAVYNEFCLYQVVKILFFSCAFDFPTYTGNEIAHVLPNFFKSQLQKCKQSFCDLLT